MDSNDMSEKNVTSQRKIDIEFDVVERIITIGRYVIDTPLSVGTLRNEACSSIKLAVLGKNDIDVPTAIHPHVHHYDIVGWNQFCAEYLGRKFNYRLRSIHYRVWLQDDKQSIFRHCHLFSRSLSPILIARYHEFRPLILQARMDNQETLIPWIMLFGRPPQDIRNYLGKGLWKSLCRNSVSRNQALTKVIYERYLNTFEIISGERPCKPRRTQKLLSFIQGIYLLPSSILRKPTLFIGEPLHCVAWAVKIAKEIRCLSKHNKVAQLIQLTADTYRMAKQLDQPYSQKWSLNRMAQEHKKLVFALNTLKYTPQKLDELFNFHKPWIGSLASGELRAELITTRRMLIEEGIEMNHCVASYADDIERGGCVIYRISCSTSRSTVEINGRTGKIVQHESYCGYYPTETHRAFAKVLEQQTKSNAAYREPNHNHMELCVLRRKTRYPAQNTEAIQ